jgi:hypothetical protein
MKIYFLFILLGLSSHSVLSVSECGEIMYPKIHKFRTLCCSGSIYIQDDVPVLDCCGERAYNINKEVCCNDVIHKKSKFNDKCCGNQLYNRNLNICCNEVVNGRMSKLTACCGQKTYNIKWEQCCFGEALANPRRLTCEELLFNTKDYY